MKRKLAIGLVCLALLIGAGVTAMLVRAEPEPEPMVLKSVTLFFSCPTGTLTISGEHIEKMVLVQIGENDPEMAGLAYSLDDEAAAQFGEFTKRSIGSLCHFYGNGALIASAVIRSPIFSKSGVVQMDRELAEELVKAFNASRETE